jgi:hypothetical protein
VELAAGWGDELGVGTVDEVVLVGFDQVGEVAVAVDDL